MNLRPHRVLSAAAVIAVLVAPATTAGSLPVLAVASAAPTTNCTFVPRPAPHTEPATTPTARNSAKPYIGELSAFSALPPSVLKANLSTAISVNNSASTAEQKYAVNDNYAINEDAIFNALGSRLFPAFRSAEKAGELPKTTALLLGKSALVNKYVDTSAAKKHFQYRRPFEEQPARIKRYGDGRADLYDAVAGSGAFPSGHTAWGYSQALVLSTLLPELGPQLLARGAEYGHHRVVLGVHYPLDVIGGRILAQAAVSDALADPTFAAAVAQARTELRAVLAARVGGSIADIVACQQSYVSSTAAAAAYRKDLSWGLPRLGGDAPAQVPAGAITLLRAAHPDRSDAQLRDLLVRTAGPAGYPLDVTGGWQRIDLLSAWLAR